MALGIDFVLDRPITTVPTCSPLGLATVFLHIRKGKTYKVNKPVATKESIGNFDNVLELGYYCVTWIFGSQLVRHFTLRVQQSAVKCETQTKDKVFVNMVALTQYRDSTEKASETFYKLSNTRSQLQAYVFDVIRDRVPKLNLDHAFKQKHDIAKTAESLKRARSAFGFKIVRTLIVDTEPERGK